MAKYLGDFNLSTVLYTKFTMVNGSGVPTTLGDSPTFGFYQDANVTLFTAGVTVTGDFNSMTGLNHLQMTVTTSATGIAAGSSYQLVIATGSVSGISVKGYPIAEFSILTRSPLRPATAGRTLLVSSTGYGAIDWAAIGTPGSTQSLSATTLFTTTNVTNDVGAIVTACNTIVPARITAQGIDVGAIVTAINTNVGAIVTAVSTIVPARVTAQGIDIGAIVTAVNTIVPARVTAQGIDVGAIVTAVNTIVPARVTAQGIDIGAIVTACNTIVPANVTAYSTVLSVNVTAYSTIVAARVTALSAAAVTVISAGVWDQPLADVVDAGSTGEALNAAGGAGDPWITALPGAYAAGQAGNILGSIVQAGVTAIQAKVTGLAFTVAGQVDANIKSVTDITVTGTGTTADPWGP